MLRHGFRVVLAVGFASAAAMAGAQTESLPVLVLDAPPADPDGGPGSTDAPGSINAEERDRWEYAVGAGAGWESDVGLQVSTPGPSDFGGSTFLDVSWLAVRPRSRTRMAGGATATVYAEQTDYNRWEGDAGFSTSRKLSRNTTGALGLAADYGYTDTSRILSDQGQILPITRAISYAGNIGVSTRLSSRNDLRVNARAYRVDFPDSDLLQDSTSLRLTAAFDRRLGQRDTLGAEYSSEGANRVEGSLTYWTHYVSANWQRTVARETSLRVRMGASYTPALEGETSQLWRFYGGVGLSRTVRGSRLGAAYNREVLPVFGLEGVRFADRFTLTAAIPLGRSWQMDLAAYYMMDAETAASGDRAASTDGSAGLSTRLSRRSWLSARGRYYRRASFEGIPTLDNYRVGLFFVYGTEPGAAFRY
jgi:hypothetical protein